MNTPSRTGMIRILCAALGLLQASVSFAPEAIAASWQWSSQPGRERVEIRFDAPIKEQSATRIGTTRLAVNLGTAAESFSGAGKGALVRGVTPKGTTLEIDLRDPAFGYVVSKPDARTLRVDVFADALGARWKGPDTASPTAAGSLRVEEPARNAAPARQTTQTPQAVQTTPPVQTASPAQNTRPAQNTVPAQNTTFGQTPDRRAQSNNILTQALGPAPIPPADASEPATRRPGDKKNEQSLLGRVDPRTTGRAMSDGRAVVPSAAGNEVAQRGGKTPAASDATPVADANGTTTATPVASAPPSLNAVNKLAEPPLLPGQQPIKTVADPTLPTQADLARLTSRLESMGVGEPRQNFIPSAIAADPNAPEGPVGGTVRARMLRPGETPETVSSQPVAPQTAPVTQTSPATQAAPATQTPLQPTQGTPSAQRAPLVPVTPSTNGPVTPVIQTAPRTAPITPAVQNGAGGRQPADQVRQPVNQVRQPMNAGSASTTGSMENFPQQPLQTPTPPEQATPAQQNTQQAGAQGSAQGTRQPMQGSAQGTRQPMQGAAQNAAQQAQPAAQTPTQASTAQPTHATKPASTYEPPADSVVERTNTSAYSSAQPVQTAPAGADNAYVYNPDSPDSRSLLKLDEPKKSGEAEKPIIYVDEHGNIVDKPPDIPALLADAKKSINDMQYAEAREKLVVMKDLVLPPETREQVLYLISEADSNLWRDKPLEGYEPVTASTSEAMNFNLDSERVPEAMYRLGMLNLNVGNQDDGAGYIGAMRNRYPHHDLVSYGYFALGRDQLKKQQYAEAVRSFQLIMDEYPESKTIRDSARGMAEALYRQGHYDRAQILVDFVDRRWPRIYLDDPSYLPMVGEIQTRNQNYEDALQTYWTAYNLTPEKPENHRILLQIGAIYLQSNLVKGARDVLGELLRKYPKSESAPTAIMLMAEQGFLGDNPTLDQMFTVFGKAGDMPVEAAYRRILREYPDSPEAKRIAIRDAALSYWNGDTDDAMQKAKTYIAAHPVAPETARAHDIIQRGFRRALDLAKQEDNYDRILTLWERFPEVHPQYSPPDDDMVVAMARAKLNRGDEAAGLADLAPFLDRPQGKYSDYVYNLFLAKHFHDNNWNAILDLGEKVAAWKIPDDVRTQLDYSMAISAENLALKEKAMPLWNRLYSKGDSEIPPYQKAYAAYFMARDAENRRDLKEAYDLNRETLERFNKLAEERSDKADPERVRESLAGLMDVTEVAGRFAESLDWSENYAAFVPQESPDYAGLLFRQARLHRKMGDMARWRNLLDNIVKREPESVFGRMAASELRTQEVSRDITRFTAPPGQSATAAAAAAAGS